MVQHPTNPAGGEQELSIVPQSHVIRSFQDSHDLLVKKLLENPHGIKDTVWTCTGLGMLRCYLDADTRLTIWDSYYKAPGVTMIHDHPWHFSSRVVGGVLRNIKYTETTKSGVPCYKQKIVTGEGTLASEKEEVLLQVYSERLYAPGEEYVQCSWEIHETAPENYTVTLLTRSGYARDRSVAHVFYPIGSQFGSAGSRETTREEVEMTCQNALRRWFS